MYKQKVISIIQDLVRETSGKPIHLRHVIYLIDKLEHINSGANVVYLTDLWRVCGLLKSLQEIARRQNEEAERLFRFLESLLIHKK